MDKVLFFIAKLSSRKLSGEWMLLFKAGWGELADGMKFFVDKAAFELVQAHIAAQGNEIVFDYEHQTIKDVKAPASGWIKELVWEDGVGIKARVEWTKAAAKHLEEQEYRFFSPVFFIRQTDKRVCGLHSAALTNTPKTKHLTPILAKLGLVQTKEESMDREKLIAALGLKDDATDAEILAAVAKLGVEIPEAEVKEVLPKAVAAALELKEGDGESVAVASIHALKQVEKAGVSLEDFNALKQEIADKNADEAVAEAIAKGKVTPDQKDWALEYAKDNLDGFLVYVAKAPQVVPVDELPGKKKKASGELTEADVAVAAMMDVDVADLKKHGKEVAHG